MNGRKVSARVLILGLVFLGLVSPAYAEDLPVKIANNGFEKIAENGLPTDWQVESRVIREPGIEIRIDKSSGQDSPTSLFIFHPEAAQSTVLSEPVSLKVGRLYRLSGWIKTEGALTNPMDRYPTSVAACMTMASFPFTNHSPAVGGDRDWKNVTTLFIATEPEDRVRLHLGFNGKASGRAWFDNIQLVEVADISGYIPPATVRWFGPAFCYADKGWIFVHIEGKPFQRGYQYGFLLAEEIVSYIKKLAYEEDQDDPARGWEQLRRFTDAVMLRKYDEEYLTEMKGIAAGAAKNGAQYQGEPLALIDIVTLNSVIDIGQLDSALRRTSHPLSGRNFLKAEDELNIPLKEHRCSGFVANGPASKNGEVVFGQIFMWSGYTGVHWNVICDVIPEKGNRLVYETFPGGIHSGADFYLNSSGIMIGETTVSQTPWNLEGTPQSNRIRKAAQYANSIDDVVHILEYKNNGMYTNDWLIGDTKTNEIAIFLLGTKKSKLWRSNHKDFPGGTNGFLWSNNNTKDPQVRKEYIPNPDNAPYDLVFSPWNRDIEFYRFYQKYKGEIDASAAVNLLASSPINRAHACDGKLTTTAMAKNMVFLVHFGKVTLREKFPGKDNRLLRDYPEAIPHLSLGYSVISPKFVTEKLQALRKKMGEKPSTCEKIEQEKDLSGVKEIYEFNPRSLWHNTVFPASDRDNWFVSGSAAYWQILNDLPGNQEEAIFYLTDKLTEVNNRLLYTVSHEGTMVPLDAQRKYDRTNHYQIPRSRGTFLLHQLRLCLGNELFFNLMNDVHDRFREKPMKTADFIAAAERISQKPIKPFIMQWLAREDLPQPEVKAEALKTDEGWKIELLVKQPGKPYHFFSTAAVDTDERVHWHKIQIRNQEERITIKVPHQPRQVTFNAGSDIPVQRENYYTWSNFYDDFHHTCIVYGTCRQIEANHTLARRFQTALADRYSEILPRIRKDSEISAQELANSDIIVLGGTADNSLMETIAGKVGLEPGKNMFQWQEKIYGQRDDGLFLVIPNPFNPNKVAYLVIGNSALQLYHMTRTAPSLASWAIFKKDEIIAQGFHPVERFTLKLIQ